MKKTLKQNKSKNQNGELEAGHCLQTEQGLEKEFSLHGEEDMKLHDENTKWVVSQMNKQKHKKVTGWSCHEVGGWIQIKSSEGERKAAKPRRLLRPALKRQ